MSPKRISCVHQWPIRRPRRVGLFVWVLAGSALFSLSYVSLYTVPVALYLLWSFRLHPRWGLLSPDGVLCIDKKGEWGLSMGESFQPLSLLHSWQGMGWLTLRFVENDPVAGAGRLIELTVWKSCVAAGAWRWLSVQVVSGRHSSPGPQSARPRSAA